MFMDEYLKPSASFVRLAKEYNDYKSLVIAVDFDNTLYDFHKKGETYHYVIALLRELKALNCYIILFTANEDNDFIKNYMSINDIPYDSINENPPFFKCDARKIYYNALLDDRAGLIQVYDDLKLLIHTLNK